MKAKLLNLKAVFCLLFVLPLMPSTFCQVSRTIVDTLYWGPGPDEEELQSPPYYYWDNTPTIIPDSVMICLFTKTDLKKIPLEIYTNNSQICSKSYETTATLNLKIVEVLTGGLDIYFGHISPYEPHELYYVHDSNANTITISFDISGTGIVDDEDMKFAISFLDSNGNVLYASNETRRHSIRLWKFQNTAPSEIKIRVDQISDLDLDNDTLVNDYSINLVKNTLHSPLFDHVASIRLDFFPPTAKYDSILNEIENIQKKIIELCGGQFIAEDDIATEKPAPAVEERVAEEPVVESEDVVEIAEDDIATEKPAPVVEERVAEETVVEVIESEEGVETAEEWQTREPAETSGEILSTSKRYYFSGKYLSSKNDIDFIRDFLLAPNCLFGLFLYPEDIETCIDYCLSYINEIAYFYDNSLFEFKFDSVGMDFPSKQAYTSRMSMLLTDFIYFSDRIVKESQSYDSTMQINQEIPSFIVDTLIPITKAIPSHKQCMRFFELIFSWQKLMKPAMDELKFMALNEDTTAQICLGQMLEQNAFLDFTFRAYANSSYYNNDDYFDCYDEWRSYKTPLHWYVMAALNGSKQGERELNRYLNSKKQDNSYEFEGNLHDELISLLEEYERQRISQYSYDKKKDLLNKMIKEVRQNRIKERQKQEKEWEKERQRWNDNQEEAAETYAE